MPIHLSHRGRGTVESPPNRFERLSVEQDEGVWEEIAKADPDFEPRRVRTEFLRDDTRSLITANDSPDIGFTHSLNPYRGCEHGCAYCYARPYHEYLGYNAGIDFETRLLVKERAPELLEEELAKPHDMVRRREEPGMARDAAHGRGRARVSRRRAPRRRFPRDPGRVGEAAPGRVP